MTTVPDHDFSFWIASSQDPAYPQLQGDIRVDVAVVGAGIAGLTTAYLLKKAGLSVAVVEKETIGSGVSGHTTGKITAQHGLIYAKLTKRLGKQTAELYAEANAEAMKRIEKIIKDEDIHCGWRHENNYVYTADRSRIKQFEEEVRVARSYGLPATFESSLNLPFTVCAAVKFANQATFHVREYLLGLAEVIAGDGSFVFERSKATHIREGNPGRVKTAQGVVYADTIVVATHVPTFPLFARLSYCIVEYPLQSYIVAGRPSVDVRGMHISPDKEHYSILPVRHDGKELLLIGGEGHIPYTSFNTEARYRRLAMYAKENFGVENIEYRWTAYDYLGYDDLPLVGRLYPWSKRLYTATGFMKWGMTNGTMAAMLLADEILEKKNSLAKILNPHRLSAVASIPKVIGEVLGVIQ